MPNIVNLFLLMKLSTNLIMNRDTKNAATHPNNNISISSKEKIKVLFMMRIRLAPTIVGIDSSKVYSTDVVREIPISNAQMMVMPDLDTPGNMAAIS